MNLLPRAAMSALLAAALLGGASGAEAQDLPGPPGPTDQKAPRQPELGTDRRPRLDTDRFSMSLGAYSLHPHTSVRLDAPGGRIGTTIDLEDDLGVRSRLVTRDFNFAVRFGERHRFELERFTFDRDGSRTNTRQFQFGSDTYEVGLRLDTSFDTDVTRLGYAYSFVREPSHEIGIHIGVHVTGLSARVRAAIEPLTSAHEEFADTTAPLPVIGAQGAVRFLPKWTLSGRAQIFRLSAEDFDGELNHAALTIEHDSFRHVGFGFGLDFFELDLDSQDSGFLGAFKLRFSGPSVYAHAHF